MRTSIARLAAHPKLVLIALLLTASPPTKAQTADVLVRAAVSNGNTYATQTRAIRIRTVVTNLGPDGLSALSIRLSTTSPSANSLDATALDGCAVAQGAGTTVNLTWAVGSMPSGTSATCEIELRARPTAQPAIFIFGAETLVAGFVDPNLSNGRQLIDLLSVSPVDIIQDMGLTITSPPGLLTQVPTYQNADFTLTNRGPDMLLPGRRHLLRSEPFLYGAISSEQFVILGSGDPDCDLVSDEIGGPNGGQRILQINYRNAIPPGTSQTCTLAVAAFVNATGVRSLRWDVGRLTPGLLETRPADNTAFLVMQYSPAIIPLDARWALGTLCAGLALAGLWRLRQRDGGGAVVKALSRDRAVSADGAAEPPF